MQPANWSRVPSNERCLYCNRRFDDVEVIATKEHLVGRNFVPRGSLDGGRSFNFIFNACSECNNDKSLHEGHISAVTQFMSPAIPETAFAERAVAKAKGETHPWTRRPVAESFHRQRVEMNWPEWGLAMSFVGPPQADRYSVHRLALRHVQGLYALVTNPDRTSQPLTLLYPGNVYIQGYYLPSDWGNSQAVAVSARARDWTRRARIVSAGGYFRAILRRDNSKLGTWFWALEWNRYLRVIGGISYDDQLPSFMRDLPDLDWHETPTTSGAKYRQRLEQSLEAMNDTLFDEGPPEA